MGRLSHCTFAPMVNHFTLDQLHSSCTNILLTTNAGLETTVKAELKQLCKKTGVNWPEITLRPFGFAGHVLVKSDQPLSHYADVFFSLRSIHHVQSLIGHFQLSEQEPINTIYNQIQHFHIPGLPTAEYFRITTNRNGKDHTFTSMQVQHYAGAGILQQYPKTVSLNHFDIEIRCDVFENTVVLGVQLTTTSLTNRQQRSYIPRISMQPHMAYAMLYQARITKADQSLLDPFCGAGTILMEAADCYPWLQLSGTDYAETAINGAQQNIIDAGLLDRVSLQQLDVYDLSHTFPAQSFDVLVTNPPFGIKLNRQKAFHAFYRHFLAEVTQLLKPGGRLVMLATKWILLKKLIQQDGHFVINDIQKVKMGGINTRIFSLTRQELAN